MIKVDFYIWCDWNHLPLRSSMGILDFRKGMKSRHMKTRCDLLMSTIVQNSSFLGRVAELWRRVESILSVVSCKNRLRALRAAICLICVAVSAVSLSQAEEPIGEVTLVLGKAYRLSKSGTREHLERGSFIDVGDQINTQSDGHVHVRFVDNALISVRPNSLLSIQRYEYNVNSPADSAVKFELTEGVTRAISGDAAKAARNRFRLNTPIAAIGVRGTDFVISANALTTRALVNEGAIIMAPYSDACSVSALGPCIANAFELRAQDMQLVSMQQDDLSPRLLPPQTIRAPDRLREEVRLAVANNKSESEVVPSLIAPPATSANATSEENVEKDVSNEVLLEGVTTVQVRADAKVAAESVASKDFIPVEPIVVTAEDQGLVAQFDLTPPTPLTSSALKDRQLIWGYYADIPLAQDRLALPFEQAIADRSITVGSLDYGLFRAEPGPRRLARDLTMVGFQLTSAQAVFNYETGVAAMTVNGGNLDINFQDNTFNTALDLMSDSTGQIIFSADGKIADGGFLQAIEATQRVAGAVSFDGAEAGYLFEKQIDGGFISGLTLWDGQ